MKDDQEEIELGNGAEDGADDGDGEGVDDVLDKDLDTSTVPFEKSDDSIPDEVPENYYSFTAKLQRHFKSHHAKANFACHVFILTVAICATVSFVAREEMFQIFKRPDVITNFESLIMAVDYYDYIADHTSETTFLKRGRYANCLTSAALFELWTYMDRSACEKTFEDDESRYHDIPIIGRPLYRSSSVGPRCTAQNITDNPGNFLMFSCMWDQNLMQREDSGRFDGVPDDVVDSLYLNTHGEIDYNETDGTNLCNQDKLMQLYSDSGYDTASCGPNSYNDQACVGGFMRAIDTPMTGKKSYGAPTHCPPGFWCPKNFVCAVPCPFGAYCPVSELNADRDSCHAPHDAYKSQTPFDSYNFSNTYIVNALMVDYKTNCTTGYKHITERDLKDFLLYTFPGATHTVCNSTTFEDCTEKKCPGSANINLCPEGYYCPNPTQALICPSHYYCPSGVEDPVKCFIHWACNEEGLNYPNIGTTVVGVYVITIMIIGVLFMITVRGRAYFREKRRAKQQESVAARNEAREHGDEELSTDQYMEIVFCGCGPIYHTLVLVTSMGVVLAGIIVVISGSVSVDDEDGTDLMLIGYILIALGGFCAVLGGIALFKIRQQILHAKESIDLARQRESVEQTLSKSPSTIRASMANRILSTEKLGSIQNKKVAKTLINIEVDKLGLKLNSNGAVVLHGVSGRINAGSVTAIMGPSGAGKTTFLNTLSARATYGRTTGKILINGVESSIESISNLVGFVPQDDVMHRELTVREILKTYARLRLPKRYVAAEVERIVEDVIDALGIGHIVDSQIGDESKRGISGGQRKRVNVGMEMVADPSLLFLDEPTSGLDSTTSFELIDALGILAKKGVNVMAVLHQPSFELYEKFTNVLLLGRGGRTVYLGKSNEAMKYFTDLRFQKPPNMNPADFFMDIIAGKFTRNDLGATKYPPGDAALAYFEGLKTKMANRVWNHGVAKSALPEDAEQVDPQARVQGMSEEQLREEMTEAEAAELRRIELFDLWLQCGEPFTHSAMEGFVDAAPIEKAVYEQTEFAGPLLSTIMFTKRALNQHLRTPADILFDIILMSIVGYVLGVAYGKISLSSAASTFLIYSLGLGMMTGILSLRIFGNERIIFWREAAAGAGMGLSPLYYFIGKNIVEVPRLFMLTSVITICFYPQVEPLCNIEKFLVYAFVMGFNMSGWAQLVSICFSKSQAQLVMVMLSLVCMLYAGVRSPLSSMGSVPYALSWISPNRWMIESLFLCQAHQLGPVFRLPPSWYNQRSDGSLVMSLVALSYNEILLYEPSSPKEIRYRATVANAIYQTFDFTPCTIVHQQLDDDGDDQNDIFGVSQNLHANGDCTELFYQFNSSLGSNGRIELYSGDSFMSAHYGEARNESSFIKTPDPFASFEWNILVSVCFGLLLRILAFIALNLNDREKMGRPSYANMLFYKIMDPLHQRAEYLKDWYLRSHAEDTPPEERASGRATRLEPSATTSAQLHMPRRATMDQGEHTSNPLSEAAIPEKAT